MSDVVLRNVCKAFGRTVAVDKFSLKVEQGEFIALLGLTFPPIIGPQVV